RLGMPQANSMFSSPRSTSPAASASTLPCSAVIAAARRPRFWSTSSRRRKNALARRPSGAAPHSAAALTAERTASSTSAPEANTTRPVSIPRAGSYTGPLRPDDPGTRLPPIQCSIVMRALGCSLLLRGGGRHRVEDVEDGKPLEADPGVDAPGDLLG